MIDNTLLIEAIKSARRRPLDGAHGVAIMASHHLMKGAWRDSFETLNQLRRFKGSKALISIPSFSLLPPSPETKANFEARLKTLLCVFDTVIIVPSPCGVSCHRYFFNELSYGGADFANAYISPSFSQIAVQILTENNKLVETGALTAIPLLGESKHRWSHPELSIPSFSTPYTNSRGKLSVDVSMAEQEDFLDLATERILAERLEAIHVNAFSFDRPYVGDLRLPAHADVGKAILEIGIPALLNVSLRDLADIRLDLAKERRAFSKHIFDALKSDPRNATMVSAELTTAAERLKEQYTKCLQSAKGLTSQILVKSTVFALSATGTLGSAAGPYCISCRRGSPVRSQETNHRVARLQILGT
jgi:hypothetical protein